MVSLPQSQYLSNYIRILLPPPYLYIYIYIYVGTSYGPWNLLFGFSVFLWVAFYDGILSMKSLPDGISSKHSIGDLPAQPAVLWIRI